MQASRIRLISRLIVAFIILVILAVLLDYAITRRQRAKAVKQTPRILSSEMIRSVDHIEYSDHRNGIMRFKIRAVRLVESRMGKSYLQGIEASDYSPDGSVRNQIRSAKAEYDRERGIADFSGDVRLYFERGIELRTDSLRYDLNAGIAESLDTVQFHLPQGGGKAHGLRFYQKRGHLEFMRDVEFSFSQKRIRPQGGSIMDTFHARAARASVFQDVGLILLEGDVRLKSSSAYLEGSRVEAFLDSSGRWFTSVVAEGHAVCRLEEEEALWQIRGNRIQFATEASSRALESVSVRGESELFSQTRAGEENLSGGEIHLKLDPAGGLPRWIESRSGVRFETRRGKDAMLFSSEHLVADFMPGTRSIQSLQLVGSARLSAGSHSMESAQLFEAEEIKISFRGSENQVALEKLRARGSARWIMKPQQVKPGGYREPAVILEASQLEMFYSTEGRFLDWGHASGRVVIFDPGAGNSVQTAVRKLSADQGHFYFYPGNNRIKDFMAEGNVCLAYQREGASEADRGPDRFQTESSNMKASFDLVGGENKIRSISQQGHFRYRDAERTAEAGRGDYDAVKQILVLKDSPVITVANLGTTTGEIIEFDRGLRLLSVHKRVRSKLRRKEGEGSSLFGAFQNSPAIITADEMRYWVENGRVRYEGKVELISEDGQLKAETLDIENGGMQVTASGNVTHKVFTHDVSDDASDERRPMKVTRKTDEMPMIVNSMALNYLRGRKTITYVGNVIFSYKNLILHTARLDALMDSEGKRIMQARAQGGLQVYQGERQCKGESADYYLDQGKLVVEGNPAEIFDPGRGRSFARRLTSFVADDRILIENK